MIISRSKQLTTLELPEYTQDRELSMLPVDLSGSNELPEGFAQYRAVLDEILRNSPVKIGIGYLTIHEKLIEANRSHRRPKPHIDGNYLVHLAKWGSQDGCGQGGGNGWKVDEAGVPLNNADHNRSYQVQTGGLLMVSSHSLCKGWNGDFYGEVGIGGDANPIAEQLRDEDSFLLESNMLYLGNSQFVHESLITDKPIERVFVRLTLPEDAIIL